MGYHPPREKSELNGSEESEVGVEKKNALAFDQEPRVEHPFNPH